MKNFKWIIFQVLAIVFVSAAASAQQAFEGEVNLKYTGRQGNNTIRYYSKEHNIRIEMGEKTNVTGRNRTAGPIILREDQLLVLIPDKKMYIERTLDLKRKVNELERKNEVSKNLRKTGDTRDILGYKAEQWILKDDKVDIEIWSTSDLGNVAMFQGLGGLTQTEMPAWQRELLSKGFFPLLMIQKNDAGEEINRLEVTSIIKKSLPAGLFEIPSGYRSMGSREDGTMQDNTGHK